MSLLGDGMEIEMKKLVFFPSDPIIEYIKKGRSYDFLDQYYNPGGYFDEVYCLSPWGDVGEEIIGKIHYIKASPYSFSKIIKKIKPDVIRGYGGYRCADWVSFNKVKGIPTVVSVHDTDPKRIHDSIKYADGVICMSQAVKDAVQKKVPDVTSNVWVMPNRIDVSKYNKKYNKLVFESLNKRFPARKHILHVGRKTEQKNLDTLIKAMKYLDEDIVTIFVGRGNIEEYKQLAKNEGVYQRCYFIERIDNDELPLWYSWCDCMCTPSRWEGFGYVFMEAAACEAAIITSNIAPMNEYLTNGKNAILVDDYENPIAIAEAIRYVLTDSDEIDIMRKNACEVSFGFGKDAIDQQEISIYETLFTIKPNDKNYDELKIQLLRREYKNFIKKKAQWILRKIGIIN